MIGRARCGSGESMRRAEVERVIRAAYAARRAEDVEAALAHFLPTATFRIVVNDRLGGIGRQLGGHDQLREAFREMFATWDFRELPLEHVVIDDSVTPVRAAVHSNGRVRHAPSGKEFSFEMLDLLTFEDGKIASFLQFFDTDMLAQFADSPAR
jgi:ketosteroid isomerase-like protein